MKKMELIPKFRNLEVIFLLEKGNLFQFAEVF